MSVPWMIPVAPHVTAVWTETKKTVSRVEFLFDSADVVLVREQRLIGRNTTIHLAYIRSPQIVDGIQCSVVCHDLSGGRDTLFRTLSLPHWSTPGTKRVIAAIAKRCGKDTQFVQSRPLERFLSYCSSWFAQLVGYRRYEDLHLAVINAAARNTARKADIFLSDGISIAHARATVVSLGERSGVIWRGPVATSAFLAVDAELLELDLEEKYSQASAWDENFGRFAELQRTIWLDAMAEMVLDSSNPALVPDVAQWLRSLSGNPTEGKTAFATIAIRVGDRLIISTSLPGRFDAMPCMEVRANFETSAHPATTISCQNEANRCDVAVAVPAVEGIGICRLSCGELPKASWHPVHSLETCTGRQAAVTFWNERSVSDALLEQLFVPLARARGAAAPIPLVQRIVWRAEVDAAAPIVCVLCSQDGDSLQRTLVALGTTVGAIRPAVTLILPDQPPPQWERTTINLGRTHGLAISVISHDPGRTLAQTISLIDHCNRPGLIIRSGAGPASQRCWQRLWKGCSAAGMVVIDASLDAYTLANLPNNLATLSEPVRAVACGRFVRLQRLEPSLDTLPGIMAHLALSSSHPSNVTVEPHLAELARTDPGPGTFKLRLDEAILRTLLRRRGAEGASRRATLT